MNVKASIILALLAFAVATGVSAAVPAAPDELAMKVEALTGGRTKIVWEGATHLRDNPQGGLVGYDTADGKSRVLSTSSSWMMPFITPDGSAVIFNMGRPNDGGNAGCRIVNWDGSNERWLVQGEYGWAHCAWVDPETKITWVYVSDANSNSWEADKCAFTKVYRVRLDKPEVRELIYETERGGLWLFVTPDGKRLWGSLRDSQEQSMLDIATKTVTPITGGCDPSHSPTEDRFFAFSGSHRHMIMYDWLNGQAANRRVIQANTMPGIEGRENVWHPRWSTHPSIFSIMGPEHGTPQIYLGRFNQDVTAVDGWVQVTDNGQWNGWSHVWVQTARDTDKLTTVPAGASTALARPLWPADRRELVFALRNGNLIANSPVTFDAAGKPLAGIALKHTRWRHYGPHHELILSGSPAEAADAAAFAVARIVQNHALTLLAGVLPGALDDTRTRRLLAIMDEEAPVLALLQKGGQLSVVIDGRWTGGKPIHCLLPELRQRQAFAFGVAIRDGAVALYVNGRPAGAQAVSWSPGVVAVPRLMFGDAARQALATAPALDSIAVYARALTADEIAAEARRWQAEQAAREAIPRFRLKGRLLRMAPALDAARIAPYTQALVVGEYEVAGVLEGEYKKKTVNVAHWGMLNRQPQPVAGRKAGDVYDLLIEPFELHRQLESEYLADTDRDPVGALYYDVEN